MDSMCVYSWISRGGSRKGGSDDDDDYSDLDQLFADSDLVKQLRQYIIRRCLNFLKVWNRPGLRKLNKQQMHPFSSVLAHGTASSALRPVPGLRFS